MKPLMNLRPLLIGIPISLALWVGLYLAWRWAFAWLGGAQ